MEDASRLASDGAHHRGAHLGQRPVICRCGIQRGQQHANPNYSCCTFRGSVAALDIANGRILWKSYTVLEEPQPTQKNGAGVPEFGPAGAAIAASPTIDQKRGVLYVATGRSTTGLELSLTDSIAAFGLNDGKLRWVKQLTVIGQTASSGLPVRRFCEPWQAAMRSFWPDSSRAWFMDSILITAAKFCGKASQGAAMRSDGGVAWGTAADHRSLVCRSVRLFG